MNIEIGKTYRGLINGCVFKIVGRSMYCKKDSENPYFDIEILNPKEKRGEIFSHSQVFLENLQIEECLQ